MRIEPLPESLDHRRQRVAQVFVFAAAEIVPRHDNARAERGLIVVKRRQVATLLRRQQPGQHRIAVLVERRRAASPVRAIDAGPRLPPHPSTAARRTPLSPRTGGYRYKSETGPPATTMT